MGIFQGDWWTYNAAAWMSGQPYIYPVLSAIVYTLGGIVGSRFLNVIISIFTIELMYQLTWELGQFLPKSPRILASLIAAFVLAFASTTSYLSRLATMDMLGDYLILASGYFLLRAIKKDCNWGQWYFLASIFYLLSFATKVIVGIYLPFFIFFSYRWSRQNQTQHYWLYYYILPLVISITGYVIINYSSLYIYLSSQVVRERSTILQVVQVIWNSSKYVWIMLIPSIFGLVAIKKYKYIVLSLLCASAIIATHLISHREASLDKHVYIAILIVVPIIGLGLVSLFQMISISHLRRIWVCLVIAMLISYAVSSYRDAQKYNTWWENGNDMLSQLRQLTSPGDKILAEVGASAILANYDKNYPVNTSTYDWFEYNHLIGEKAYSSAIKNAYFDLIEIDNGDAASSNVHTHMDQLIMSNIGDNYSRVYTNGNFIIYRRNF